MAKRKKKSAVKSLKPDLSPEVSREVIAIVFGAIAILLILAILHFGGGLVNTIFTALRQAIGYAAYLLPVIFAALAWLLFQPEQYEVGPQTYLGFTGFTLALSGLLHLGSSQTTALGVAKAGHGGGYSGYLISRGLLAIINVPASTVILITIMAICLIAAANSRLTDMIKGIIGLFRRGPREEIQINEPAGLTVNTRLPIKGQLDASRRGRDDFEALTVNADPDWTFPSEDLLESTTSKANAGNIKENAAIIQQTLESFGIEVTMGEVNVGPTVTQYTLKPHSGVKLNKITGLEHNLALSLAAHPIRVEAPIPGKSAVGLEVPNKTAALVRLRDLLNSAEVKEVKSPLAIVLGRDVSGLPVVADLSKMPHLLIAGATGSGKSIMINSLLTNLLYRNSPSDLKLILVDPKRVELTPYNDIPHLLAPVIVEPEKCISALKWAVAEMERRYKRFAEVGKRNISEYNQTQGEDSMPYIVIVIDELADLMAIAAQDVEGLIVRLAQMARATGIHLVLATQRPSVNIITGLIKANIPARIAFSVASQVDSRTILDQSGAEKLLGKGDMLFGSPDFMKPRRVQGAFMSEKEIKAVTNFLRQARSPQYNEEVLAQPVRMPGTRGGDFDGGDDELFREAADTVIRSGKASASLLQRRLRVGYARAARLLDILEERGIIGPPDGARPRDVLVDSIDSVATDVEYEE